MEPGGVVVFLSVARLFSFPPEKEFILNVALGRCAVCVDLQDLQDFCNMKVVFHERSFL